MRGTFSSMQFGDSFHFKAQMNASGMFMHKTSTLQCRVDVKNVLVLMILLSLELMIGNEFINFYLVMVFRISNSYLT